MFKINRLTLSLVHYNLGLQHSISNGSFTNLEIQHNNVVYATNYFVTFQHLNVIKHPKSSTTLLKLLFNVHSSYVVLNIQRLSQVVIILQSWCVTLKIVNTLFEFLVQSV